MAITNSLISISEDRISELPEPLIQYILSFIDTESAVKTCVLSKRWRYIWTSLPTLNFDSNIFFRKSGRDLVSFVGLVNMVLILQQRSFSFQRFCIKMSEVPSRNDMRSQLDVWILRALRRNVQELEININMTFQPVPCVFSSKLLTKLELVMGGPERSMIVLPKTMDLPRLKSLKFFNFLIDDISSLNKLFSSCPALESLIIGDGDIATDTRDTNINISFLKLKHFELSNFRCYCSSNYVWPKSIKLYAPNLTSFVCKDSMSQDYSIENLSSLVTGHIYMSIETQIAPKDKELYANRIKKFLKALRNVKELTLSPAVLEVVSGGFPDLLNSLPPQFCNLQYLKLDIKLSSGCLRATTYLLMICPKIQSLLLRIVDQPYSENIGDDWKAESSFPCLLDHLKVIKVRGMKGGINELKILEFLLKKALVLEQLFLFSTNAYSSDKVKKLSKKLLRTLPRDSSSINIHVS